jgi:hypothetical protein
MHRTTLPTLGVAAALLLAGCGGDDDDDGHPRPSPPPPARATVVVPDLVGRDQDTAHALARRAGVRLRVTGYVGKYGNGRYEISCVEILRQSPVAGERRPAGAMVSVIEHECETPRSAPTPPAGTE